MKSARPNRVHFVPKPAAQERTACGVVVDEDFGSRTPLVFGDVELWSSAWAVRGRCLRCVRAVTKAEASKAMAT